MTQPQATSQREAPKLRRARPEDVKAIAHLGAATFSATFGYSMPASDLQAYLQEAYSLSTVAHQLASPLIDVVVAVDEADQVIGFVQLTQGTSDPCVADLERPVELQRLYVDVNHHGGGVGRALVTEVEKLAKERGFKTFWLGVWEDNFKAQKAYQRFGFSKVGEHDFKMGECIQRDWIMMKSV